ncbi:MAG: conjugal transfer protein TraJ [Acidocella sp.]|nr:conjugal transfer protein TraJ [Acidocella sp.]
MNDDTKRKNTRSRGTPIKVWVTPEERAEIADRADRAGLPLSAYMRAAGLNHRIKSVYDLEAVGDLVRVNGDLGRVAGLLKLWLTEKPGQGARRFEVDRIMTDFRDLQAKLSGIMRRAVK